PVGHSRERGGTIARLSAAGAGKIKERAFGQGERISRHHQNRAHSSDGCHAGAAGPGIRWLRPAGGIWKSARRKSDRGFARARARRDGSWHGTKSASGFSGESDAAFASAHRDRIFRSTRSFRSARQQGRGGGSERSVKND